MTDRLKRTINPLRKLAAMDAHLSEVISGAAIAFLLRGLGAGLAFVLNVVIARLLGADGAGMYFLALSVTMIVSVIARLGLDNALLRFVSVHAAQEEWGQVKGVFSLGMRLVLISSSVLTLLCFGSAPWLADTLFNKPDLGVPLQWMSLGIMSFSIMMLMSECLKGLRLIRNAMLVSGVLYPLFGLILVWPLVSLIGVKGANMAYVLGTGAAAAIGFLFWRHAMKDHNLTGHFSYERLRASSQPLFIMSLLNGAVITWAPLLLLGVWGTTEESGIFGAVSRVAMLLTFFLTAVNTAIAPKFAALYDNGELEAVAQLARKSALYITLVASPLFILFMFAGDLVMSMFGQDFIPGGYILAILTLGQVVNSLTGSVGFLLIMSGREKDASNVAVISCAILIALCVLLIPQNGMLGAAIATAFTIAISNILLAWLVWKRHAVITVPLIPVRTNKVI